jgi:hypothetical protein
MNIKTKKSQESKSSLGIKREEEGETTDCLFSKVNTSRLRSREKEERETEQEDRTRKEQAMMSSN